MPAPFIFNSILGIVGKQGAIAPTVIERIAETGKRFHRRQVASNVAVDTAVSPSGRSALLVWNRTDTKQYAEGLIARRGNTNAAINGFLSRGRTLDDILPVLTAQGPAYVSSREGGVFTIFVHDEANDEILASNTLHGTRPTLWADTSEYALIGTSVVFVSWVGNGFSYPNYNLPGIADYVLNEQYSPFDTPFIGTQVLPANTLATATIDGLRQEAVDDGLKRLCLSTNEPTEAYYDDLSQALLEAAQTFADGTPYAMGLSGGRDSRLLLSSLLAANVDISVQVNGFPEDADVVIAQRIAKAAQVPITVHEKFEANDVYSTVEIRDLLWTYLRNTEGMSMSRPTQPVDYRAHFFANRPGAADKVAPVYGSLFSGLAGEMWRGGSFLIPSRGYMEGRTWLSESKAQEVVKTFGETHYTCFLRPEFKEKFSRFFYRWVEENSDPANYMRIFELIAIVQYYGMNHNFIDDIVLLADNKVTRKIQDIALQHRILERPTFEVIARLAPQLRDIPLESTRWAFEKDGPTDKDREGWEARAPIPHAASKASNYAYYMVGVNDAMRRGVREMIFDSSGSQALFEVVDREAVERLFRTADIFYPRWCWFAWNLAQAALVLSDAIIPETAASERIVVEVRTRCPMGFCCV